MFSFKILISKIYINNLDYNIFFIVFVPKIIIIRVFCTINAYYFVYFIFYFQFLAIK